MRASQISRYLLVVVAVGVAVAVGSAALCGCGAAPQRAPAAPVKPPEPCPSPAAAPAPKAAPQESLLERVPASAVAAVILRRGALGVPRGIFAGAPAMKRELSEYLTREVGLDPTEVDGLVAWSSNVAARSGALFVRLRHAATPKGKRAGQHRGVDLVEVAPMVVAAALDGGLVVGSPTEVATAIDLGRGQLERVGTASALGFMLAADAPDVDIVAGAHLPGVVDPTSAGMVQAAGLRTALLTFTRGGLITARVHGDRERLGAVREMYKAGIGLVLAGLERSKDQALGKHDVSAAVGASVGYHQAKKLAEELEPRVDGSSLVSQYRLPQLAASELYLFYGGMAAAIAIPAFVKYVRRSKEAEGRENVRRIADAARDYWVQRGKRDGRRFAFPATTPWTPALECCKTGGRCPANAAAWDHPTWKALGFSVPDAHRYQYRFVSEGKGVKAKYTVEARASLDCDTSRSTFSASGDAGSQWRSPVVGQSSGH
jgi:type IV pilus assembly protein PilA